MSLSNSILVNYTERSNGGSTRALYKLEDKVYTNDLTSVGVGVWSAAADADTKFFYSPTIGGLQTIAACSLKSGDQELDGFTAAMVPQEWFTIDTLTCSNRQSVDVNRPELHSGWGFTETSRAGDGRVKGSLTLQDPDQDFSSLIDGDEPLYEMVQIAAQEEGTSTQINWARVFPFLKASPVLPAIPKLNITHVYNKTHADFLDPDGEGLALTNMNPLLLSNEVLGQELSAPEYVTRYNGIVIDRGCLLPAPADPVRPTITNYICTAYNGLYLENLYPFLESTGPMDEIPTNNRSLAMVNEKIQIIVNGFPLLPEEGIVHEAEKMLYQTRTKGSANVPLACYMSGLATRANNRVFDAATTPFASNMSLCGIHVGAVIESLQIQYQRTSGGQLEDQNMAAILVLIGEYAKEARTPNDGDAAKVTIAY